MTLLIFATKNEINNQVKKCSKINEIMWRVEGEYIGMIINN